MISKESADAIAQALLEQAQSELNQRKNAMARHGRLFYRFPELNQFEPWKRDVITRRCESLVHREPAILVLFAVWLLFALALAFNLRVSFFRFSLGQFVVFAGLLIFVFHRWRVGQNVRAFVKFAQEHERHSSNAG